MILSSTDASAARPLPPGARSRRHRDLARALAIAIVAGSLAASPPPVVGAVPATAASAPPVVEFDSPSPETLVATPVPTALPVPTAAPASPSAAPSTPALVVAAAHRTITTTSPEAQAAYDHGLILLYGFNIGAAREAFALARARDPQCAMASYGEALTEVTDINVQTDAAGLARGSAALARARRASEATPAERELIAALARRFAPASSSGAAESAYEKAMMAFASAHPDDTDGGVAAAFAVWQAEPNVTTPGAANIGRLLDRALARDPLNFGAHHLRIHFEEQRGTPERALEDANFLLAATYEPGLSHLPHMAGHIYVRLGDYARVIRSNEIAIANDAAYFAAGDGPGQAYMKGYHHHDLDFVLYGLTTLGRDGDAMAIASREDVYARTTVALRLHDWKAVLAGGTADPVALAIANANLGNMAAVDQTLEITGKSAPPLVLGLIAGARARFHGDVPAEVRAYQQAYRNRPGDPGDPKVRWQTPVGEAYGAALLRAGRFADAERVFSDELARYPNDPHLLYGRAYAREGLHEDAGADRAAAAALWRAQRPPSIEDLG